jgi:hypothetical protein
MNKAAAAVWDTMRRLFDCSAAPVAEGLQDGRDAEAGGGMTMLYLALLLLLLFAPGNETVGGTRTCCCSWCRRGTWKPEPKGLSKQLAGQRMAVH